jgi:hypothetical protein
MNNDMQSLKPMQGVARSLRARLTLKDELFLALLPTLTVLLVFALAIGITALLVILEHSTLWILAHSRRT